MVVGTPAARLHEEEDKPAFPGCRWSNNASLLPTDARQSWRNPALVQQMQRRAKVQQQNQAIRSMGVVNSNEPPVLGGEQQRFWKKYRMMVKSGTPLLTLQRTARMHGVDTNLLNDPKLEQERRYWKRYHLMIKSGLSHMAVAQANSGMMFGADLLRAENQAKAKKQQKEAANNNENNNNKEEEEEKAVVHLEIGPRMVPHSSSTDRFVEKYTKMHQSGVSKRAIESIAEREVPPVTGINKKERTKGVLDLVFATTKKFAAKNDAPVFKPRGTLGIRTPRRHNRKVGVQGLDQLVASVESSQVAATMKKSTLLSFRDGAHDLSQPDTDVIASNDYVRGASNTDKVLECLEGYHATESLTLARANLSFESLPPSVPMKNANISHGKGDADESPVEIVYAFPVVQDTNHDHGDREHVIVEDTDVSWDDTDQSVTVTLDVPGFCIEQLRISLTDCVLTVHGMRQDDMGDKLEFHEELLLASSVYNTAEIQASFFHDVLTITIPKFTSVVPVTRSIPIYSLDETKLLGVDEVRVVSE